jgi:hypothetical protein
VLGSRPLLTFDIPQTALVATLDTYDFSFFQLSTSFHALFYSQTISLGTVE